MRTKIVQRLKGSTPLTALATLAPKAPLAAGDTIELLKLVNEAASARAGRTIIVTTLRHDPGLVREAASSLSVLRLMEAISNLGGDEVKERQDTILDILQHVYTERFDSMTGAEKTHIRKAIAYIDEQLFRP